MKSKSKPQKIVSLTRDSAKDPEATFTRDFSISLQRDINEEERTVEVAFSSEEPVDRGWMTEILDHGPKSVDLSRLNNKGAVLVDHRTERHVGVVESARVDNDRIARAMLRFGRGAEAEEIFQDVVDGIRSLVSVAYRVHKWEIDEKTDEYRAVLWEPYEISIVSIPADPSVGVGRSQVPTKREVIKVEDDDEKEVKPNGEGKRSQEPAPVDTAKIERGAVTAERKRANEMLKIGEQHGMRDLALEYIDSDNSVADFNKRVLEEIGKKNAEKRSQMDPEIRKDGKSDDHIGLSEKEKRSFSLLRAMAAIAFPTDKSVQDAAGFEREVSKAAADKLDIDVRGIFIPSEVRLAQSMVAQRTLSAGTATDGAELVANNLLAGDFIGLLRNLMITRQAGARVISGLVGNVDIPRQTSGASATWVSAEDGDSTESEAQFDQVALRPKDLAVHTQVTRRLLMQSTPDIEMLVADDLMTAQAIGLDLAGLYGSGAAGQPTGIVNQTGINTTTFAAAAPTHAEVVAMETAVSLDNALLGNLAYIADPTGRGAAKTTQVDAGSGRFLWENGEVNGYNAFATNQVTAEDWFFGNWLDLVFGLWGGVDMTVDPYTNVLKGRVQFVTFQTADVAVRHPDSFCYSNDGA